MNRNIPDLVELTPAEMRDTDGGVAPRIEVDPITGEVRIITCTDPIGAGYPF